jgi:hypothetical protein
MLFSYRCKIKIKFKKGAPLFVQEAINGVNTYYIAGIASYGVDFINAPNNGLAYFYNCGASQAS